MFFRWHHFFKIAIVVFWITIFIFFLMIPYLGIVLGTDARTINVMTWGATLDPVIIEKFEKESGIKVNFNYIESNEELFVKMYTTGGKDYDLVMPSDYMMQKLIDAQLIKKIDKSKIDFWHRIQPRFLQQYFDGTNSYSIPFFWALYGLGINKDMFTQVPPASWSLLFSYPIPGRVAMLAQAREAISLAAQYLFKSIENITPEKVKQIEHLLVEQKSRVEVYVDADIRTSYLLLSETCPVVVGATPYFLCFMKENPSIDFLIPQEGTFILIDSFALSCATQKDDLIYQFLNYLYKPEVLFHHFENLPVIPVTKELEEFLNQDKIPQSMRTLLLDPSIKATFFKNVIPEDELNALWMAVKAA
ncbi:MAG: PotD/PotF family extracellular solute-binding protein [Candidatus Babeliales bacterium]